MKVIITNDQGHSKWPEMGLVIINTHSSLDISKLKRKYWKQFKTQAAWVRPTKMSVSGELKRIIPGRDGLMLIWPLSLQFGLLYCREKWISSIAVRRQGFSKFIYSMNRVRFVCLYWKFIYLILNAFSVRTYVLSSRPPLDIYKITQGQTGQTCVDLHHCSTIHHMFLKTL